MDKSHKKAQVTMQRNKEIREAAQAQRAQSKAAIMAMLETVATTEDATTEQKLEAARLAVELNRGY
ncbi:hypothetical protein AALA83_17750 [Oscillospiraceae bacterium 44-5]